MGGVSTSYYSFRRCWATEDDLSSIRVNVHPVKWMKTWRVTLPSSSSCLPCMLLVGRVRELGDMAHQFLRKLLLCRGSPAFRNLTGGTRSFASCSQERYQRLWQVQESGAAMLTRAAGLSNKAGGGITVSRNEEHAAEESRRRNLNKILYRSRQRGYLELDLLLGKWAEDNAEKLDETRLEELVVVLDEENPDLWKWLTGQAPAPPDLATNSVFSAIQKKISENLLAYAPPETRAQPGQPWVRGWDDNRKTGGPQIGNQ